MCLGLRENRANYLKKRKKHTKYYLESPFSFSLITHINKGTNVLRQENINTINHITTVNHIIMSSFTQKTFEQSAILL